MTDEQEFFAWLDGELDGDAAARVEARVASEPALARQAAGHRALQERLRAAFHPLMAAAVPDRPVAIPVDLAIARERRSARRAPRLTQWAAIAATLVVGIVTGTMLAPSAGPVARQDGAMVARGPLEDGLNARLASAPQAEGVRVGVTFRDSTGAICRSFEDETLSGVACRNADEWQLRGLFPLAADQGDYRMAAGPDPRLGALIDSTIAGDPFDAVAEREARDRDWR